MKFYLRQIKQDDIVNKLSLGHKDYQPLKTFLKDQAKELHINNVTKTYVLVADNEPLQVKAYISLVCSEINIENNSQRPKDCQHHERYKTYPAVKIARMAVDKDLQRSKVKFGTKLMDSALAITRVKIMPHIGCRYLLVDAKPFAIGFYEKQGFILLDHKDNEKHHNRLMLLDIHQINLPNK